MVVTWGSPGPGKRGNASSLPRWVNIFIISREEDDGRRTAKPRQRETHAREPRIFGPFFFFPSLRRRRLVRRRVPEGIRLPPAPSSPLPPRAALRFPRRALNRQKHEALNIFRAIVSARELCLPRRVPHSVAEEPQIERKKRPRSPLRVD
jgi:hypothetical protein